jgi:cytosine/adenosine deaminase-related metal-dependent hydrolase
MRIHMHLLETRYQREWADAAYPDGLLNHLDRLGVLSSRLTVAHGVWLRPDEMELLATRGVIVSLNTCSNLRLRSGIAPAREMSKRGVAFGLGIDGFSIDDDDDALRELRLVRWLHDGPGLEPGLSPQLILTAATSTGAGAVTGRSDIGRIGPGQAADIMAIDWAALTHDAIAPLDDPLEMLFARASRQHMRHLWVAGNQIVRDGVVVGVDEPALESKLLDLARKDAPRIAQQRPLARRYQAALRRFYSGQMHRATPGTQKQE